MENRQFRNAFSIRSVSVKIIIVGAGEVGFHIAQRLSEEGQDVVLIDKDPRQIKRITENLDVQAFLGSGTSPSLLKNSGIETADMLVAATDSDEVNLIACLLARNLNQYMLKVARVRNQEFLQEKELLGQRSLDIDHIINPQSLMVKTILSLMEVPGASEVIDFVDGRVKLIGFTIKKDSPFKDRQLLSFKDLEEKLLVGAIVRRNQVMIPRGNDTIQEHDLIYVMVRNDELNDVLGLFDIKEETLRRVIIIGAGQTGTALATALDHSKVNVKIIDKNSERCADLAEKLERVIVINGDGADKNLLQEENIGDVDFMVTITGDEANNILISLLAKGLGAKKTITRVSKLSYIPLVSAIGIDTVVSPRLSAVRAILQYIRRGKVISVAPLKGEQAEAIEAEALETSDIVNIPLSKVKFPKGAIIGAIVRGEQIIIPRGDSVIMPKDRLIIFALEQVVPKLEKLLTVKLEYF
ncbi:MAG: Trk system potassium transporter TrkA [Deltaproteobacteria bacterium]|nr:Trk system potassium transporter TrkA [Deltaproteobacteria bacterium]MBW1737045.1 Trk system potassium transporter TrkA [Deltaproteobacteria bacterium]MBW1909612.1 Trk system potassium transporter TrkA [Deltaproteobacteria bacterium]MBW2033609.1 Trk system potassium transporter TrkA [Deltaproteobacteria bacterium]MBW2114235.1 Trk system potassium transporter TrkA [Deltaproteobacteria bacterium]